jgi:hypothetical protein
MPSGRPHNVYIDDDLWEAGIARAERDKTSIARVINFGLRAYLGIDAPMQAVTTTKPKTAVVDEAADYPTTVNIEGPFGSGDRQEESAIASDEATAVITRRVTSTKPKADDFEKTRRPGEYTASEMADIDAERLARMKTGKRK